MKEIKTIIVYFMLVLGVFATNSVSAAAENATPVIVTRENCADLNLDESYLGYYVITNSEDLYSYAEIVNGGNSDANAVVLNDILLNEDLYNGEEFVIKDSLKIWNPIGLSEENGFTGTFDGNNKVISGVYCNSIYSGLFGYNRDGVIKNLIVNDSFFSNSSNESSYSSELNGLGSGSICSVNFGEISHCIADTCAVKGNNCGGICSYNEQSGKISESVSKNIVFKSGNTNSGICGVNANGSIKNCRNYSNIYIGKRVSGIADSQGQLGGIISGCINEGNLLVTDNYSYVGGICSTSWIEISDCKNYGNIEGVNDVGGIVGDCRYVLESKELARNINYGNIIAVGENVGGIAGNCNLPMDSCINEGKIVGTKYTGGVIGKTTLTEYKSCTNKGDVEGTIYVGGICGYNDGRTAIECANEGNVTASGYYVGGINGYIGNSQTKNCLNLGIIKCVQDHAGGINGYNEADIIGCLNIGLVDGSKYVGALVGENRGAEIADSYYKVEVAKDANDIFQYAIGASIKGDVTYDTNNMSVSQNDLMSGKVAYLLNENQMDTIWGQKIGVEDHPSLGSNVVYCGYENCQSSTQIFSNDVLQQEKGHKFTNYISDGNASCTEDGTKTAVCDNGCGTQDIVVDKGTVKGHFWDNGTVTKDPTETAEGVKIFKCMKCDKLKTEVIPKIKDDKETGDYEIADATKKEVEFKVPTNKNAKTITIPATIEVDGVTYKITRIDDKAFKGNKKVTKVIVGSNITTIGKKAFCGATKLKIVTIGKNVAEIGARAFKGCVSLTSVTLPRKTNKIGANVFSGCKKLKILKISSSNLTSKTVDKNAFKGLTKATTIKVPKNRLTVYKKLFKYKGLSSKVKVKGY